MMRNDEAVAGTGSHMQSLTRSFLLLWLRSSAPSRKLMKVETATRSVKINLNVVDLAPKTWAKNAENTMQKMNLFEMASVPNYCKYYWTGLRHHRTWTANRANTTVSAARGTTRRLALTCPVRAFAHTGYCHSFNHFQGCSSFLTSVVFLDPLHAGLLDPRQLFSVWLVIAVRK